MKISEIIASQRRRLGLKQYELAEQTGIAPSQISIFERGSVGMVSTNLEKILDALDLSIVNDRQSVQRKLARKCARVMRERKIEDLRFISREELAACVGNDELLLLPVVSDELYRRYCRSQLVDETNTWNYFVSLVQDYYLDELDGVAPALAED